MPSILPGCIVGDVIVEERSIVSVNSIVEY